MSIWDDRWAALGRRLGGMDLESIKQEAADIAIGRVLQANMGNKTKTKNSFLVTSTERVRKAARRTWPDVPPLTTFKATGAHMGYLDYTSDGQAVEGSWGFGFLVQRETMREVSNLQEIVGATRLVVTVEVIE